MRWILTVSAFACAVAACRSAAPTPEARGPASARQILFARAPKLATMSPFDLYLINEDGSGLARLTTAPGAGLDTSSPSWSPEGQRIAFARYLDPEKRLGDVFTAKVGADAQGKLALLDLVNRTQSPDCDDSDPAWSPDCGSIAFSSEREGGYHLWALSLATGQVRRLTSGAASEIGASWSPTGDRIAFVRVKPAEGNAIWVLDVAAGTEVQLTPYGRNDGPASWSPSGKRIVLSRVEGQESSIVEIDAADLDHDGQGDNLVTLVRTPPGFCDGSPAYSAEGERIVFARGSCGGPDEVVQKTPSDIYVLELPSGALQNLTQTPGGDSELTPVWRPSRSCGAPGAHVGGGADRGQGHARAP